MTDSQAKQAVLVSGLVTVGSVFGSYVMPEKYGGEGKFPSTRAIAGAAIAFTTISVMSQFAPTLATAFALAVAVTAYLTYGAPIMEAFFTER